jgi:hypothetical protein
MKIVVSSGAEVTPTFRGVKNSSMRAAESIAGIVNEMRGISARMSLRRAS